jgi:hypothetical protein
MDTQALPQKTLAIWVEGRSSALSQHTVVVRSTTGVPFNLFLLVLASALLRLSHDGDGALLFIEKSVHK